MKKKNTFYLDSSHITAYDPEKLKDKLISLRLDSLEGKQATKLKELICSCGIIFRTAKRYYKYCDLCRNPREREIRAEQKIPFI